MPSAISETYEINAALSMLGQAHSSPIVSGDTDWKASRNSRNRSASMRPSLRRMVWAASTSMRASGLAPSTWTFGSRR